MYINDIVYIKTHDFFIAAFGGPQLDPATPCAASPTVRTWLISWDNDRNPGWWCNNHLEKYEEFVNGVGILWFQRTKQYWNIMGQGIWWEHLWTGNVMGISWEKAIIICYIQAIMVKQTEYNTVLDIVGYSDEWLDYNRLHIINTYIMGIWATAKIGI